MLQFPSLVHPNMSAHITESHAATAQYPLDCDCDPIVLNLSLEFEKLKTLANPLALKYGNNIFCTSKVMSTWATIKTPNWIKLLCIDHCPNGCIQINLSQLYKKFHMLDPETGKTCKVASSNETVN